jgi:serine/threonine-protein kinase RsbW
MVTPCARGPTISLSLQLPRDQWSVPLARHLIGAAMLELGVVCDDRDAVQLALSEACTNAVRHAGAGDSFEVTISIEGGTCDLRIEDHGQGWRERSERPMPPIRAECGRGLALMQALVDRLELVTQPDLGTIVHLAKALRFVEDAPGRRRTSETAER